MVACLDVLRPSHVLRTYFNILERMLRKLLRIGLCLCKELLSFLERFSMRGKDVVIISCKIVTGFRIRAPTYELNHAYNY